MPDSFCESGTGLLLAANGMEPVLRWDGLTLQMEPAGVNPPATAPSVSGSGTGGIVGDYYAYVRFVDRLGNLSNLSPVSAVYSAQSTTGTITGVTNATPVAVTSAGHGLTTGTVVKIDGVGGASGVNNTWAITVTGPNTFTLDDSTSAGVYTGGGTWTAGVSTLTFASLPVPDQASVRRRQILRNTDGQAETFYVDIDTTDLSSTSLSSTRSDSDLSAQTAVPLLAADDSPLANRFTVPPDHKAVLAFHLDRMFTAVEVVEDEGNVQVTFGSAAVRGVGTGWKSGLAGRVLYVNGATRSYEIASVDTAAQTLTLTEAYQGGTDPYARYGIRPAPAERRLVYYSEAGLPEAWPATNAISLQEDGDEITGLMVQGSFLYILERRNIYRFTFQSDPATDGYVFLSSASRGCVNNRCWVGVGDVTYMLDERGVHGFSGGRESENVSLPIQDVFRPGGGSLGINWSASRYFHAVHYPQQEVIRWFVALSGSYLPRHALCYNYALQAWWVEEFAVPVGASCEGRLGGRPCVFLGSSGRRVLLFWEGNLDGVDPTAGTVRGTATAAGLLSLTDAAASFAAADLVGHPVTLVDGKGKGQTRTVVAATATTLKVDRPWLDLPDATSVYQVGGVGWSWRSGWFHWVWDEQTNPRRVEVQFEPTRAEALATLRVYKDREDEPVTWRTPYKLDEASGVRSRAGDPDLVIDLAKPNGFAQKRLDGHREHHIDGWRHVGVGLSGCSGTEDVRVEELKIDGAV